MAGGDIQTDLRAENGRIEALGRIREGLERRPHGSRLSDRRYDEIHEHFERSSDQQRRILEWLGDFIVSGRDDLEPIRILSVGCGSGILDNVLIETLSERSGSIEYAGIDPNDVACDRFRSSFEGLGLENVQLDLHRGGIESFAEPGGFDVILVVHSLYYFSDPASALDTLRQRLAPGGKLVVVHAPKEELNQLAECFWTQHASNEIWFSECLARHLTKRRVPHERERLHGRVNVSRCFEDGCSRGEMLLDFITQTDCRHLGDELRAICLEYLRRIGRREGDRFLVSHPVDVFAIPPPRASLPAC